MAPPAKASAGRMESCAGKDSHYTITRPHGIRLCSQGAAGAVAFGEPIGLRWACGAALLLLGVTLCTAGRQPQARPAPDNSSPHED